jgi:hypothetical protein
MPDGDVTTKRVTRPAPRRSTCTSLDPTRLTANRSRWRRGNPRVVEPRVAGSRAEPPGQRRSLRSSLVPLTAIVVHVTRPGDRADTLLAAVANQLGRETPTADERGHVRLLLEEPAGIAWDRVHHALDAAGDDWHEHLHVNPRPP